MKCAIRDCPNRTDEGRFVGPLCAPCSVEDYRLWKSRALDAEALINTPEIVDFQKAVVLEAAHQRKRWGSSHDGGKSDADWLWLIGYLAGKVIRPDTGKEKKLHRIITIAAAACNWHAAVSGANTSMRPGIEEPS